MTPSITSAAEAIARAGVPATVSEKSIEMTLAAIEALVQRWLGYDPRSQSVTLYLDGSGTELLSLGHPVTAVSTVHENWVGYGQSGNFTATELLTVGENYHTMDLGTYRPGILVRIGTVWPYRRYRQVGRLADEYGPNRGSVRVACTTGLSGADLAAVAEAVYAEFSARYASRRTGVGIASSVSLDGYSRSTTPFAAAGAGNGSSPFVSPAAFQAIRPYRRTPMSRL